MQRNLIFPKKNLEGKGSEKNKNFDKTTHSVISRFKKFGISNTWNSLLYPLVRDIVELTFKTGIGDTVVHRFPFSQSGMDFVKTIYSISSRVIRSHIASTSAAIQD